MAKHTAEVAFFACLCGLWIGLGLDDDGWLPWFCAAIYGAVALAGIALAPAMMRDGAQEGEG